MSSGRVLVTKACHKTKCLHSLMRVGTLSGLWPLRQCKQTRHKTKQHEAQTKQDEQVPQGKDTKMESSATLSVPYLQQVHAVSALLWKMRASSLNSERAANHGNEFEDKEINKPLSFRCVASMNNTTQSLQRTVISVATVVVTVVNVAGQLDGICRDVQSIFVCKWKTVLVATVVITTVCTKERCGRRRRGRRGEKFGVIKNQGRRGARGRLVGLQHKIIDRR